MERLEKNEQKKQQMIASMKRELRSKAEEERRKECTFQPKLNEKSVSRGPRRTVEDLYRWESNKKKRLLEVEMEQMKGVRDRPAINKTAERKGKVEDRLLECAAQKEEKIREELRRREELLKEQKLPRVKQYRGKEHRKIGQGDVNPLVLVNKIKAEVEQSSPTKQDLTIARNMNNQTNDGGVKKGNSAKEKYEIDFYKTGKTLFKEELSGVNSSEKKRLTGRNLNKRGQIVQQKDKDEIEHRNAGPSVPKASLGKELGGPVKVPNKTKEADRQNTGRLKDDSKAANRGQKPKAINYERVSKFSVSRGRELPQGTPKKVTKSQLDHFKKVEMIKIEENEEIEQSSERLPTPEIPVEQGNGELETPNQEAEAVEEQFGDEDVQDVGETVGAEEEHQNGEMQEEQVYEEQQACEEQEEAGEEEVVAEVDEEVVEYEEAQYGEEQGEEVEEAVEGEEEGVEAVEEGLGEGVEEGNEERTEEVEAMDMEGQEEVQYEEAGVEGEEGEGVEGEEAWVEGEEVEGNGEAEGVEEGVEGVDEELVEPEQEEGGPGVDQGDNTDIFNKFEDILKKAVSQERVGGEEAEMEEDDFINLNKFSDTLDKSEKQLPVAKPVPEIKTKEEAKQHLLSQIANHKKGTAKKTNSLFSKYK